MAHTKKNIARVWARKEQIRVNQIFTSTPHFIRCIKAMPSSLDNEHT